MSAGSSTGTTNHNSAGDLQARVRHITRTIQLTDEEFGLFQDLIYRLARISLSDQKKALVAGRLNRRLRHLGLPSFRSYYEYVNTRAGASELQLMVDALTTNETSFFREPDHFHFLGKEILEKRQAHSPRVRIWSAACSSGEEPYSLAMVCHDRLGSERWQILATDISRTVLERAERGVYSITAAPRIPDYYLKKYALKGVGNMEGMFTFNDEIKNGIRFQSMNLADREPCEIQFDCIFLRNVMIYFDRETKSQIVRHMEDCLIDGGYLFIGHSESLHGLGSRLKTIRPSVYRKS